MTGADIVAGIFGTLFTCAVLGIGLCIYFVPWYVAHRRHHPQETAIAILNVCLSWTFVGWVIALVWAATAIPAKETSHA